MFYPESNPYVLKETELSHIPGLTKKANTFEQIKGMKTLFRDICSIWTNLLPLVIKKNAGEITPEENKTLIERCDKIINGTYTITNPRYVLGAGLSQTTYLNDMKTLALRVKNASPKGLDPIIDGAFVTAMIQFSKITHWQNWEVDKFPNTTALQAFHYATDLEYASPKPTPIDIFAILKDTVNGSADPYKADEASAYFVEYLQTQPEFKRHSTLKLAPPER